MKKLLLLLVILLSIGSAQAQNLYEINLYDLNYRINRGVKNRTSSNINIEVVYSDGSREELYYRDIRNEGDAENGWRMASRDIVRTSKLPVRIDVYCFVNFRTGTDANATIPANFSAPCVDGGSFSGYYSPRMSTIDFKYDIKPIFRVEEPSYRIQGYESPLTLTANIGISDNLYRWQYAISYRDVTFPFPINNTIRFYDWVDVPAIRKNAITVTPENFLPDTIIGEDVFFRVTGNCSDRFGSNIISYEIVKNAPNIKRVTSTPPSCFDAIDGTITIEFDRALDANDNLSVAVGDVSEETGGVDENDRPNLQSVAVTGGNNITLDASNRVTLTDVPPSRIEFRIDIVGSYNGTAYFTGGEDHSKIIVVNRRPAVAFKTKPEDGVSDVFCHGGNDGAVTFTAEGGVGDYQYVYKENSETWSEDWKPFPPGGSTVRIPNLSKGTYQIKIKDGNDCPAKIQSKDDDNNTVLGEVIVEEFTIIEPSAPLSVVFDTDRSKNPKAFGFTDGIIIAKVTGGTPDDDRYNFEWKNEADDLLTNINTRILPAPDVGFELTLDGVPKGKYYLTVWDKNYNNAGYKTTCIIEEAFYELFEPDPLVLTFEESNSISCNNTNQYGDESGDGELIVHAKGGIQLEPNENLGLPYIYTWKKQNVTTGVWDELSFRDSIATNLDTGTYAVNIIDKNGITLGDYTNNILVRERDSTYFLDQPKLLTVSFKKEDIICNSGNNGWAEVIIDGGTPPYEISWSTGEKTPIINNLFTGKYTVFITDTKGCRTTGTVTIEQPNGLEGIVITEKAPTCYKGTDGLITIKTQGGTPPYRFRWDSGQNTESIDGLSEGTYTLEITDVEGCISYIEVALQDPEPIRIDLGEDRTICLDQTLVLDIGIPDEGATYLWESENGFSSTSSKVELTRSGTYTATLMTSSGCTGTDTVQVNVSDAEIDTDFLLLSQAFTGREVTMVNVSLPDGEKVEWTVPDDPSIKVISKDAERLVVVFDKKGSYDFTLRTYQGACYQDYQKTIFVEETTDLPDVGDARNPFIEEFLVYPNPSDGKFTVKVSLAEAASISLRMFNLTDNKIEMEQRKDGQKEYLIDVSMSVVTGVYVLIIETPEGDEIRKIVMQ